MIGAAIFVVATLLAHKLRGKEEGRQWFVDGLLGAAGTAIVGVVIFVFYVLFIYPTHVYRDDQAQHHTAEQASSQLADESQENKSEKTKNLELLNQMALMKSGSNTPFQITETDPQARQGVQQMQQALGADNERIKSLEESNGKESQEIDSLTAQLSAAQQDAKSAREMAASAQAAASPNAPFRSRLIG